MAVRVSKLSIRELKERFADPQAPVSPQLLAELKRDPRRGARDIYAALVKRRDAAREERDRLEAMLSFERILWRTGKTRIAGVDEAGMAPLAGPVVAAAVVFPPESAPSAAIEGIDDSKRLDPDRREELASLIRERAAGIGIGLADIADIDQHNIYHAGLLAMRRAVEALPEAPEHVLVDAREIPGLPMPQNPFTRGDGINYSIAAASIIAKTHRDQLMNELDERYPGYGFARHKGYPTAEHQRAIRERGPCEVHRTSFTYFRELLGECSPAFYEIAGALDGAPGPDELEAVAAKVAAAKKALPESEYRKLRTLLQRRQNRR